MYKNQSALRLLVTYGIILQTLFSVSGTTMAQHNTAQYPGALSHANFDVDIGFIDYKFTNANLEPGFSAGNINVPHVAVKLVLYGRRINDYLSAQITYMRPVGWVEYQDVNGDGSNHSVWMNIGALTLKSKLPISKKVSMYGEAGFAMVTRRGFRINGVEAMKDAVYGGLMTGVGVQYHLNPKWNLHLAGSSASGKKTVRQPTTLFLSGGFTYTMRPLSTGKVKDNSTTGLFYPRNLLQVGYSTNALGYGVNNAVSKGPIPIFWGGDVHLRRGFTLHYQRNIFHTKRVFSFDWGTSLSYWQSRNQRDNFYTISLFPLLRFTALRTKSTDLYFNYSVAGPTYISKTIIDNENTGRHFTFQDFMGMGIYTGRKRSLNAELRIAHYSNGNIFPQNVGLKVPLTFNVGMTF